MRARAAAAAAEPPVGVFQDRAHLVADGEDRVERAHRVLEHHRHRGAAQRQPLAVRHGQEVAAVIEDAAAGDRGRRVPEQPHDRLHGDGLARAALADQRDMRVRRHVERDALQHALGAAIGGELDREILGR